MFVAQEVEQMSQLELVMKNLELGCQYSKLQIAIYQKPMLDFHRNPVLALRSCAVRIRLEIVWDV